MWSNFTIKYSCDTGGYISVILVTLSIAVSMVIKLYYLELDKYVTTGGVLTGGWDDDESDLDESEVRQVRSL